jgi:HSP20 family protein
MSLIRYQEPWNLLNQLQKDINNAFSGIAGGDSSSVTADWIPAVDITEYADRFELEVDLPGIDVKDVDITLDNNVLTLAGERKQEKSVGDQESLNHRRERGNGRFYRRFILPDTVDEGGVKASGRNGVLQISIPKQPKAQPRKIKVAS